MSANSGRIGTLRLAAAVFPRRRRIPHRRSRQPVAVRSPPAHPGEGTDEHELRESVARRGRQQANHFAIRAGARIPQVHVVGGFRGACPDHGLRASSGRRPRFWSHAQRTPSYAPTCRGSRGHGPRGSARPTPTAGDPPGDSFDRGGDLGAHHPLGEFVHRTAVLDLRPFLQWDTPERAPGQRPGSTWQPRGGGPPR